MKVNKSDQVRFGSLADIAVILPNVRFTPESVHRREPPSLPLIANSRHRRAVDCLNPRNVKIKIVHLPPSSLRSALPNKNHSVNGLVTSCSPHSRRQFERLNYPLSARSPLRTVFPEWVLRRNALCLV